MFRNIQAAPKPAGRHFGAIAVREEAHTTETRIDSSDMPPHLKTCMRPRRDDLVALLPSKAPALPNPGPVDPEIYPFDFRRTAFDRWTSAPGSHRPAHGNTSEQGLGQTDHQIPSVWARRGCFPPPSAGSSAVREGGHTPEPRAGCLHLPPHFQTCMRAQRKIWWHSYPPKAPGHTSRHAKNNPHRGNFSDTSSSQKNLNKYHTSCITCASTV